MWRAPLIAVMMPFRAMMPGSDKKQVIFARVIHWRFSDHLFWLLHCWKQYFDGEVRKSQLSYEFPGRKSRRNPLCKAVAPYTLPKCINVLHLMEEKRGPKSAEFDISCGARLSYIRRSLENAEVAVACVCFMCSHLWRCSLNSYNSSNYEQSAVKAFPHAFYFFSEENSSFSRCANCILPYTDHRLPGMAEHIQLNQSFLIYFVLSHTLWFPRHSVNLIHSCSPYQSVQSDYSIRTAGFPTKLPFLLTPSTASLNIISSFYYSVRAIKGPKQAVFRHQRRTMWRTQRSPYC